MIKVRPAEKRGRSHFRWLDSRHTFSFADYYDPAQMGFGALRVINDDRVTAGSGFGTHPHRDMEIISYVVDGALEHKDSMCHGSVIRPGEVQRMSAGSGVRHSEFNPSGTDALRFLQIWIVPEHRGLAPSYEQRAFPDAERRGAWRLVASRDGRDGSVTVHQDVNLYATLLEPGQQIAHTLEDGRGAWLQVVRGGVKLYDRTLAEGDGVAVENEAELSVTAAVASELLLFDLDRS
jgi:redox-sensitive bicupin YhaK (pirin superfamily)